MSEQTREGARLPKTGRDVVTNERDELVEMMHKADLYGRRPNVEWSLIKSQDTYSSCIKGMSEALNVAVAAILVAVRKEMRSLASSYCDDSADTLDRHIRARFIRRETSYRVTIERDDDVFLDGKYVLGLPNREHAEIYRRGLIAKLEAENG